MNTQTDVLDDVIDNLIWIAEALTAEGNYSQKVRDLIFDTQLTLRRAGHPRHNEVWEAYHEFNNNNPWND